ncbi:hypothetical protein EDB19DRAFT_1831897 [Suillus lakei]|nr:hypothetical protein EDB19DRAFT_1831897 [Suillus lakei]
MANGWRFERQERITLWEEQVEEDAHILRERLERERAEKEVEEQEEHREAEKKKPKINDFDAGSVVANYAIQKIKNMEYVELWYLSPDGCHEASTTARSTSDSDDAYGFAKVDGIIALKTLASFKASHKALQDHDLSWRQLIWQRPASSSTSRRADGRTSINKPQNQGFNIGLFNNALYGTISDNVWEAERDEGLKLEYFLPPLPTCYPMLTQRSPS